jgi:hypothetical protein
MNTVWRATATVRQSVQLALALARFSGTTDGPLAYPTATPDRPTVRPSVSLTAMTTFLPPDPPCSWAWTAPKGLTETASASAISTRIRRHRRAHRLRRLRRTGGGRAWGSTRGLDVTCGEGLGDVEGLGSGEVEPGEGSGEVEPTVTAR